MRWLINYIRSCFCQHDWELLRETRMWDDDYGFRYPIGTKWTYRCKKCGWHKIIKNY
jgi:hypothetical protein